MFIGSFALAALYAHLLSWGTYAIEIPFVKAQAVTGTLSKAGLLELAENCIALNKWECAKDAYLSLFRKGDVEALAQLGFLQERLSEKAAARASYLNYFKAGGQSASAAVSLGHLFEAEGNNDEAMRYFELAVAKSGETLPVNGMGGIVRLLIKQGKFEEALTRIEEFHKSAGNARGYLNAELTQVQERLGKHVKSGRKKKAAKRVAQI